MISFKIVFVNGLYETFSPSSRMLVTGFVPHVFYQTEEVPNLNLLNFFFFNELLLDFVNCSSTSIDIISLLDMIDYIGFLF